MIKLFCIGLLIPYEIFLNIDLNLYLKRVFKSQIQLYSITMGWVSLKFDRE